MELKICFHRANFTRAGRAYQKFVCIHDKRRAKRENYFDRFVSSRAFLPPRNQLPTVDNTCYLDVDPRSRSAGTNFSIFRRNDNAAREAFETSK